jgi:CheY-like chemotaxis protein
MGSVSIADDEAVSRAVVDAVFGGEGDLEAEYTCAVG